MKLKRYRRHQISIFSVLCVLMLIFNNCTNGTPTLSDSAPVDPPTNSPADNDTKIWNAPVGDLVKGATLYDGWTDLRFISGDVNLSAGWTDSVAISNDGMSLHFSYSRYSFSKIAEGEGLVVTGPARTGMTGNSFKSFKARLGNSGWVVDPMLGTPFNTDANLWESSLSFNAAENLAIWTIWDANLNTSSLYYSYKQNGSWIAGQALPSPINAPNCRDDNGFVVGDVSTGVHIYWESDRIDDTCTAGGGKLHQYYSYFNPTNGTFTAPIKVPGLNGVAANDEDHQIYVSPDRRHVFWTAVRSNYYGLYTADLVGDSYINARPVLSGNTAAPYTGKLTFMGEANIVETSHGWVAYLVCGIATKETGATKGVHISVCRMKKPKPANFTKKINTEGGWSDSPYISRDGKRLYFMYSRYDFGPFIKSGGVTIPQNPTGPDRPGLNKVTGNPFDESDIYVSTKNDDGTWGEPVNLGLNGAWGDASGMEYNNGNSFIWLRGDGVTNDIVMATKTADGKWGPIENPGAGINNVNAIEDNPYVDDGGTNMWFVSSRTSGSLGKKDLWYSSKAGGTWSAPVNVGGTYNGAEDEDQPFIPNGGGSNEIYWNNQDGIKKCISDGVGGCTSLDTISFAGCAFAAEISIPDDGQTAYFGCGDFTTYRVKIMYSVKQPNGSWGPAIPID